MAFEHLSGALADAGSAMTRELDEIGLVPQGALWLHSAALQDWRYCVISDLVPELGRPMTYDLIGRALDKVGPIDGLTIFDVHLFEPSELVPTVLGGAFRVDGLSRVSVIDGKVDGLPINAIVYRITPARDPAVRRKAASAFKKRVAALA